jgi:hypothetical protein
MVKKQSFHGIQRVSVCQEMVNIVLCQGVISPLGWVEMYPGMHPREDGTVIEMTAKDVLRSQMMAQVMEGKLDQEGESWTRKPCHEILPEASQPQSMSSRCRAGSCHRSRP